MTNTSLGRRGPSTSLSARPPAERRPGWNRQLAGITCVSLVAGLFGVLAAPAQALELQTGTLDVVVEGTDGSQALVTAAVQRVGGTVDTQLSIIDGVRATVDAEDLAALRAQPGVDAVTSDTTLVPLDGKWGDDTTKEGAKASKTGEWKADDDQGSAFTITEQIGAQAVWDKADPHDRTRGLTGHGVAVAVIDTGIAPVEGLLTPGKIVNGPDLSPESQADGTRYVDGFGHGTHMAALIAGKDSTVKAGGEDDAKHFVGVAPDARLVNVRVGAADGGVDVSQVIAGIDWVVTNKAEHNIRVINLSYGTDSSQSPSLDPLAHAVESAWRAGVVVVVAAGNDGELGPRPLTMPAVDPYVIAVGSMDHQGVERADMRRVGPWTNSGTDTRRPDLLAPGKSVVSLRVPGSSADVGHPEGLVTGDESGRFFRGTGTSQSAAVVSGAVALLLQRNPELTPDQVKGLLQANADRLPRDTSPVQGAGTLDVEGAVKQLEKSRPPAYTQTFPRSTGLGSLDASRGGSNVVDPETGAVLDGEQDLFGTPWDATTWAPASSDGTAWDGGTWRGSTLAGPGWDGDSWASVTWAGRSWSGEEWSGRRWSTMTFLGRSWRGDDWSGRRWSGDSWSGRRWSTDDAW